MNNNIKVIAFYLPQFHTIPENDYAHGKGFTEWTNTRKAKPLFEGHYQPRTPLNQNYYDLLDEKVMEEQAKIAGEHGVFGFCYYHYWFGDGKKLLERPIENMLANSKIDIPFCLCWANENWSKRWDGGNNEVIVKQDYGNRKSWEKHIQYLLKFFMDDRYIKIDNMPILVIYKPELIPHFNDMMRCFQKIVKESGFDGVKIISQFPTVYFSDLPQKKCIDYYIHFEPKFIQEWMRRKSQNKKMAQFEYIRANIKNVLNKFSLSFALNIGQKIVGIFNKSNHNLEIRNYDDDWQALIKYEKYTRKDLAGAFVDWDNTPRNRFGLAYKGADPEKFSRYFSALAKKVLKCNCENVIFINAWNEWAEGAYLEPDEKYGYAYLDALKRAIENLYKDKK